MRGRDRSGGEVDRDDPAKRSRLRGLSDREFLDDCIEMRKAQALPWLDRSRKHDSVLDPQSKPFCRPAAEAPKAEGVCARAYFLAVAPPGDGPHLGEVRKHPRPTFRRASVKGHRRARSGRHDQRHYKKKASAMPESDTARYRQEVRDRGTLRTLAQATDLYGAGSVSRLSSAWAFASVALAGCWVPK